MSAISILEAALLDRDKLRAELRKVRSLISATHKHCVKHENCRDEFCPICVGGLFICADCGAAEGETEERICTASEARVTALEKALANLRDQAAAFAPFCDPDSAYKKAIEQADGILSPKPGDEKP